MSQAAPQKPNRSTTPWLGLGVLAGAVMLLIAFVATTGVNPEPDRVGEDDAGVVHPQPAGVDDDVVGRPSEPLTR